MTHTRDYRRAKLVEVFERFVDRHGPADPGTAMLARIIQLHDARRSAEAEADTARATQSEIPAGQLAGEFLAP